ncbi:MAG: photosynthetic complex assembly protein PuhC [Alphaproteobacteria bacterium]|nr:photosynthetic complex assembly protein PuhC [Alphaproteobacteria bacterium]
MNRQEILHRRALAGIAVLVVITIVMTAIAQLTGAGARYTPNGEAIATAELRFEDQSNGVVAVYDGQSGARIVAFGMDEGVFVRSVMRGVARQRRLRGDDSQAPVELSRQSDGELWLTDPVTGVQIYLGAFGPDNLAAFNALLDSRQQISASIEAGEAS